MISMLVAFVGNLAIVSVFAMLFYSEPCATQGLALVAGNCTSVALGDGIAALGGGATGPSAGAGTSALQAVFLVGLVGAGLASMISSTLAGQSITEGFLKIKLPFWQRLLITRAITLGPTLLLTILPGDGTQAAGALNEWLNVLVSLLLPFALVPVVYFSTNELLMHEWRMQPAFAAFAWAVTATIIVINCLFSHRLHLPARRLR